MRIGPAWLPFISLISLLLFCTPSFAVDYDAITSDPPAAKETHPLVEAPFFGDRPDVRKDEPEDDAIPFFGKPVAVDEEPAVEKRRGGKFEIPADAAERNDLSFLEGCWYFEKKEGSLDTPGRQSIGMIQNYYCFNKRGKGRVYIQFFKYNKRRSGPASAHFDKNGDIIMENPRFDAGIVFVHKGMVRCSGREAGTQCFTHCPNCKYAPKNDVVRLSRTP